MDFGERQPNQTDVQFVDYPILEMGDLILEMRSNKLWRIVNTRTTEKNRTAILQVARVDAVNKSDIEYTLAVPEQIRTDMLKELEQRERTPEF